MKKTILTAVSMLALSANLATAQVKLQPDQIDNVLKAMTLEEKAMLVVGGNRRIENQGDNGIVGGHAHQVPGAAGMTQAIDRLGEGLKAVAWAPDGVIEAVEMATFPDLVAVQWHPEITAAQDAGQQKLFEWLVIQAARHKHQSGRST